MEQKQNLSIDDVQSILESVLFTVGRSISIQEMSKLFYAEKISVKEIKKALTILGKKYQELYHGIELKEVAGGWQLKTKEENKDYIRRLIKGRLFQLSAPALEVLTIVAYRQPCKKAAIDEIRGVESGHLLKTLVEKSLIALGPKSSDPGHYVTYKTTAQFLEVFGLKSLKDLPSDEDVRDLLSSENESVADNEGLNPVLNDFKKFQKSSFNERKVTENELEWISRKISSVKPKINWDNNDKSIVKLSDVKSRIFTETDRKFMKSSQIKKTNHKNIKSNEKEN